MDKAAIARRIDHTLLRPDATAAEIDRLCEEALEHRFASVCVHGMWVRRCAPLLAGSGVAVGSVAGFPHGAAATAAKVLETRIALDDGAGEIDVVLAIGALKDGDLDTVRRDLEAVAQACRAGGALLKAILETGLLDEDEKKSACAIARSAGAHFVKTSTGFAGSGATAADVALLRREVGPTFGVKAAGGIRDLATVLEMLRAGADRIGTSRSVEILR